MARNRQDNATALTQQPWNFTNRTIVNDMPEDMYDPVTARLGTYDYDINGLIVRRLRRVLRM